MQTPEGITIIPISQPEVLALLKSEALAKVEERLAAALKADIIYDDSTASLSEIRGEISVSGLTTQQIECYLSEQSEPLVRFALRFLQDEEATKDDSEGEEQDPDEWVEELGYANGFGIKMAIYHDFLANRTPKELRAYLKNRKIPKHTKFAKQLEEIFAGLQSQNDE